ncbi:hypothetical protein AB0O67_21545 [Streptomyces sp. NPDC086077]|uniref:hypothetical protein n=1 Tax=Streptomyces sp. NPDC086077 TaxID=3154862 RepID=UPI00342B66C9
MNNAKVGAALIGGYALGRNKNAKAALGLALAMAVRRAKAGDLAEAFAPVLGNLSQQARTELAGVAKAAATSVVNAQVNHLADSLHQRTLGLQGQQGRLRRQEGEDLGAEEPREEMEERQLRAKKAVRRMSSQPKSGGVAHKTSSRPKGSSRARESDDD